MDLRRSTITSEHAARTAVEHGPVTERRRGTKSMWGSKKKQPTEMKRTCNRCGAERYVALADARLRMPNADKLASARKWTAAASVFGKSGPATQLTALELQIARAAAAVQCPKCGSESFSEEEVPI